METKAILLAENDRVRNYLKLVIADLTDEQGRYGHTAVDERPIGAIVQHIYGSLRLIAEAVRAGGVGQGVVPQARGVTEVAARVPRAGEARDDRLPGLGEAGAQRAPVPREAGTGQPPVSGEAGTPGSVAETLAYIDRLHDEVAEVWRSLSDSELEREVTLPWGERTTGAGALLAGVAHAHRHIGHIIDARCLGGFKTRALG